jgi:hypothetical protein
VSDPLIQAEVTDEGVEVRSPETRGTSDKVETLPLSGLLGIHDPGPRQQTQLKEIWDFLAEKANGTGDLLHQFRHLENRMSPPRLGETRLGKVYNYVALQRQLKQTEEQLNSL